MRILSLLISVVFVFSAQGAFNPVNKWVSYELSYDVTVPRPSNDFTEMKIWIPLPQTTPEQKVVTQNIQGLDFSLHQGEYYGNKMAYFFVTKKTKFPIDLKLTWKVQRRALNSVALTTYSKSNDPKKFLAMNNRVPISGVIAEEALKATKGAKTKWKKIERMYDHVVASMSYDKSGEGWGEGDAIWACDAKRGNCTDFHSLLVGMARSQKIPAQFQIGIPTPVKGISEVKGYHCWAKLFDEDRGWVPVDASESKKANQPRKYFGTLPANRIHFTTGRDLVLSPKQNGAALNYFIYPYLELDGTKYKNYTKKFSVRTL